ncbi:MAG TPA: hypothetical protein P5080_00195 [Candidatus Paceibacterota bacterium]|nr:hypothetical protein [Candidatus Pacearchaeota archaeon]HRZ50394.1 hypothetical protein [Candidatus Paceibacterota bacterium]HSA36115.1 hypothetical protein [Candidatus Paceibacterota bacterium]
MQDLVQHWLKQEAARGRDEYRCKRCGQTIMARKTFFSVHDGFTAFGGKHVGNGEVKEFPLPECPNEGCPNHRPAFWGDNLKLVDDRLEAPCCDI